MASSDPQPGVPTPTGTLMGCAQFTWSGAAWTSGGAPVPGPGVPTPTGTLRGIAPFYWSGTAWVAATHNLAP
jgi:hypothetical protein